MEKMSTSIAVYEAEELIFTFKLLPEFLPREGELFHLTEEKKIYRVIKVCHALLDGGHIRINIFVKREN